MRYDPKNQKSTRSSGGFAEDFIAVYDKLL